jgi:hypothetical protein
LRLPFLFAFLVLLGTSAPSWAHHSFAAEYNTNKPVKLTGAVTKIDWSNPHVYFYIDVEDDPGKVANWPFEMGVPSALRNTGRTRTSSVTVEDTQAKDGGTHGNARAVTLTATGKHLGAASGEGR